MMRLIQYNRFVPPFCELYSAQRLLFVFFKAISTLAGHHSVSSLTEKEKMNTDLVEEG